MAKRCTQKEWKQIKRDVLAATPLPHDFDIDIVRRDLGGQDFGIASAIDVETTRFLIEIENDLTADHTTEILIHELAHILDWRPTTAWSTNHGPTFWIHYGEIWRAYHQVM